MMNLLKEFKPPLTKLEKLMICNNPPESVLQFSLVKICTFLCSFGRLILSTMLIFQIVKDLEEKQDETEIQDWLEKINDIMKS